MIYIIVRYNGKDYDILHWSHRFEDADKQYDRLKAQYDDVQLLVDVRAINFHESAVTIKKLQESIRAKNKSR